MNDRVSAEILKAVRPKSAVVAVLELLMSLVVWATGLFTVTAWLLGFVFAKGFFSTFFCIIPFWAWYLDLEHLALALHWI